MNLYQANVVTWLLSRHKIDIAIAVRHEGAAAECDIHFRPDQQIDLTELTRELALHGYRLKWAPEQQQVVDPQTGAVIGWQPGPPRFHVEEPPAEIVDDVEEDVLAEIIRRYAQSTTTTFGTGGFNR